MLFVTLLCYPAHHSLNALTSIAVGAVQQQLDRQPKSGRGLFGER